MLLDKYALALRIFAAFLSGCTMIGIIVFGITIKEVIMGNAGMATAPLFIFACGAVAGSVGLHLAFKKVEKDATKQIEDSMRELGLDK